MGMASYLPCWIMGMGEAMNSFQLHNHKAKSHTPPNFLIQHFFPLIIRLQTYTISASSHPPSRSHPKPTSFPNPSHFHSNSLPNIHPSIRRKSKVDVYLRTGEILCVFLSLQLTQYPVCCCVLDKKEKKNPPPPFTPI